MAILGKAGVRVKAKDSGLDYKSEKDSEETEVRKK